MGVDRRLADLLDGIDVPTPTGAEEIRVRGITDDSHEVGPGTLFVAVPGAHRDGRVFIGDAVRAGAVAVVTEAPAPETDVPLVLVRNARGALAELAAVWHGRPAAGLRLIGITGTVGKTSVLAMLQAILEAAGQPIGAIGSLGARWDGQVRETEYTTPDALTLHGTLADMRAAGMSLVAMEVTSHGLLQGRVDGLTFELGIFTNLMLLEHMEYHASFAEYVAAKVRFFGHFRRNAPLMYASGDRAVDALVRSRPLRGVGVGFGSESDVRLEWRDEGGDASAVDLHVVRRLPCLGRDALAPSQFALRLRLLGRPNLTNAGLAAASALCLGAAVDAVIAGLESIRPPRRRMETLRVRAPTIIDDTVGHPDSITAVFEVAEMRPHDALHVVFAIRGSRGRLINERDAETLLIWAARVPIRTLVVTWSEDTADERNRVSDEEREAFLGRLLAADHAFIEKPSLERAIGTALDEAGENDLVLLLGAQGMDAGAAFVRARLG